MLGLPGHMCTSLTYWLRFHKTLFIKCWLTNLPKSRISELSQFPCCRYRDAGAEVIAVLQKFSNCVERASIDEAYLDLTDIVNAKMSEVDGTSVGPAQLPNTHVVGWDGQDDIGDKGLWGPDIYA